MQTATTLLAEDAPLCTLVALQTIRPGQQLVYHRGRLLIDRCGSPQVEAIALEAYRLATEEPIRVFLTQQKRGRGRYQYLATGRKGHLRLVS